MSVVQIRDEMYVCRSVCVCVLHVCVDAAGDLCYGARLHGHCCYLITCVVQIGVSRYYTTGYCQLSC
jgi:hypothetical protein